MSLANAQVTTTIRVEDLEGAKSFYGDKLGLKDSGSIMEGYDALFEAGAGTMIYLYSGAKSVAEHTVAAFIVEDVEAAVKELKEKGVEFESYDMPELKTNENNIATMGDMKSAWFKDPEGHILAIGNK